MIRRETFEGCTSLQTIVLPDGLRWIGGCAFKGCTSLQKIALPKGLRKLNDDWNSFSLFSNFFDSFIGGVFEGCTSLLEVIFPEELQAIGSYVFKGCTSLHTIILPEGLQEIGKEAFQNCSIEELKIPRSVQMIEDHAFYGNKLKQLEIFIGYKDRIADIFGEIDEKIITWIN